MKQRADDFGLRIGGKSLEVGGQASEVRGQRQLGLVV